MAMDYEGFKKEVFRLTKIDLNAYKEKQMKRRIDTLITKNRVTGYENYIAAISKDEKIENGEYVTDNGNIDGIVFNISIMSILLAIILGSYFIF